MKLFWLTIVSALLIWPVHSTIGMAGDKPIDLFLTDLLFLVIPVICIFARTGLAKTRRLSVAPNVRAYQLTPWLALIFVIYAMSLAGIGLGLSGEKIRLFSAFKLTKPIGLVFFGLMLGSSTDPFQFIRITSRVYGVLVGLTMFCTVTDPDFPLGDWGRFIFDFEISGYPNSPMSFYAALIPLLLSLADCSKNFTSKLAAWCTAGCSGLMIVGSMSRSSALVMICGVTIYLVMTGRKAFLAVACTGFGIVSVIGFGLFSMFHETEFMTVLTSRIQSRLERSVEIEDPSAGRFEIWEVAIELWTEKPILGYMFEPFSHYFSEYDTPHQQYLEVLYKCGGLGFVIYFALLVSCLLAENRLRRIAVKKSHAWFQLTAMRALLISIMIGNLTQPNLTYSLTGNFVFFLFGSLCSSRAMMSVASPINGPTSSNVRPLLVPAARIAA